LVALPNRLGAQSGTIRGRVADAQGAPLPRAAVSVDAIGARTTTDEQGTYEIRGVPTGTHTVRVRLLGYVPQSVQVTVSGTQPTRQDFALVVQPITLSPVDVTVGSRARHAAANELAVPVDVFGAEDIKRQGTTEMSQILQQLTPSVNFPHQSVTDAGDIVRPFTLRGLSPDQQPVFVNGGWGIGLGRGSLALFGEFLDRQPTNRAYADQFEDAGTGVPDSIDSHGQVVIKRNPVEQPSGHWGDGLEKDVLTMANFRMPLNEARTSELYAFGGYSFRRGTGNGYRRCAVDCASFITGRAWPQIYPLGYLPEFHPDVADYSVSGGFRGATHGWSVDLGASFGHNDFKYNLRNTLNVSLGPCLNPAAPCAPGPDHILETA